VDGVEVGGGTPRSAPISYALTTTNDLFIGQYAGCPGLGFTGTIDQPEVWMRALTADRVASDGIASGGGGHSYGGSRDVRRRATLSHRRGSVRRRRSARGSAARYGSR
jgi:hypothetical protein